QIHTQHPLIKKQKKIIGIMQLGFPAADGVQFIAYNNCHAMVANVGRIGKNCPFIGGRVITIKHAAGTAAMTVSYSANKVKLPVINGLTCATAPPVGRYFSKLLPTVLFSVIAVNVG